MRKIIITESQFREICENNSIYLDTTEHGSEKPENIEGVEVTTGDKPVTTDKVAGERTPYRPYGWRSSGRAICEDDNASVNFFKNQKERAAATGTKMGKNIANGVGATEGTNRKRKFDLKKKMNTMGKEAFEQQYGDMNTMVSSRLESSRSMNSDSKFDTDGGKSNNANSEVKLPDNKTLYLYK